MAADKEDMPLACVEALSLRPRVGSAGGGDVDALAVVAAAAADVAACGVAVPALARCFRLDDEVDDADPARSCRFAARPPKENGTCRVSPCGCGGDDGVLPGSSGYTRLSGSSTGPNCGWAVGDGRSPETSDTPPVEQWRQALSRPP